MGNKQRRLAWQCSGTLPTALLGTGSRCASGSAEHRCALPRSAGLGLFVLVTSQAFNRGVGILSVRHLGITLTSVLPELLGLLITNSLMLVPSLQPAPNDAVIARLLTGHYGELSSRKPPAAGGQQLTSRANRARRGCRGVMGKLVSGGSRARLPASHLFLAGFPSCFSHGQQSGWWR